jgi:hypothetical protein
VAHTDDHAAHRERGIGRPAKAAPFADGGLPLMAVFDRPRTIVQKSGRGREVELFNATFAQAIIDIGVGVEMCAPRSGNQKGTVERLVGWVKGSFFKHRKFMDEEDLRAQLAAWHVEVNTQIPSRATGVIPETRRQEELERLRPIKVFPENLALRVPIVVGRDGAPHRAHPPRAQAVGSSGRRSLRWPRRSRIDAAHGSLARFGQRRFHSCAPWRSSTSRTNRRCG